MFTKARIKLTFFYVLIIAIGMVIFSVVFYSYSVQDVEHDISRETTISETSKTAIVDRTLRGIENGIIIADSTILIILGFLCYFLAGKTLKPIKRALDDQELFSGNASHELRTPLAVMKLENEVFLQDPHPTHDGIKKLVTSNLEEIDRMTGIVENLLLLARSKTTKQNLHTESLPLSELVEQTAKRIEKVNQDTSIPLHLSIAPDIVVTGNKKLLEEAIGNIIQNAFTYTHKGFVQVSLGTTTTHALVTITDSGIGIHKKDLARITEPFFKADQSRGSSRGVGLGLAIVQEIVHLHRGVMTIESIPEKGTTVTLTIPLG